MARSAMATHLPTPQRPSAVVARAAMVGKAPPPLPPLPPSLGGETQSDICGDAGDEGLAAGKGEEPAAAAQAPPLPADADDALDAPAFRFQPPARVDPEVIARAVPAAPAPPRPEPPAGQAPPVLLAGGAQRPEERGTFCLPSGAAALSLPAAARCRKARGKVSVSPRPAAGAFSWNIEASELCNAARRSLRKWARGGISGEHCLLRLERCADVAHFLQDANVVLLDGRRCEDADAGLWIAGCPGLGGASPASAQLAAEVLLKPPCEVVGEAWRAIEKQCGIAAHRLEPEDVDLALRQIGYRAQDEPLRFLQVQIWQELLRLHTNGDCEDFVDDGADEFFGEVSVGSTSSQSPVIQWLGSGDAELYDEASELSLPQLRQQTARSEEYAIQIMLLSERLRSALETWSAADAYETLGLARTARSEEVAWSYFRRALRDHPEGSSDEDPLAALKEAYEEIMAERRLLQSSSNPQQAAAERRAVEEQEEAAIWHFRRYARKKARRERWHRGIDDPPGELSLQEADELDAQIRQRIGEARKLADEVHFAATFAGGNSVKIVGHSCILQAALQSPDVAGIDAEQIWSKLGKVIDDGSRIANSTSIAAQRTATAGDLLEYLSSHLIKVDAGSVAKSDKSVLRDLDGNPLPPASPLEAASRRLVAAAADATSTGTQLAQIVVEVQGLVRSGRFNALCGRADLACSIDVATAGRHVRSISDAARSAAIATVDAAEACAAACKALREALSTLLTDPAEPGLEDEERVAALKTCLEVSQERRDLLFALLAEFLDAGALQFHEAMEHSASKPASPISCLDAPADWATADSGHADTAAAGKLRGPSIMSGAAAAFGFMDSKAAAGVAVIADIRSQVLHTALRLDAPGVEGMLEQLFRRLDASVNFACSRGVGCRPDEGIGEDVKVALAGACEWLRESAAAIAAAQTTAAAMEPKPPLPLD
eukprot:TRINITY_DN54785_c0_g1_i2.p1 TRINITY_DN54785_c0_g1~~TRINITY_DN54785_c0_g1_i2.p1  ORF type:complete len:947 (-),score=262.87 TRINITY_DN54785_c0_g1_i2:156-2996(-)